MQLVNMYSLQGPATPLFAVVVGGTPRPIIGNDEMNSLIIIIDIDGGEARRWL